jgi:hypothetical protein
MNHLHSHSLHWSPPLKLTIGFSGSFDFSWHSAWQRKKR